MVRGSEYRVFFAKGWVKHMTALVSLVSLLVTIITLALDEDPLIATIFFVVGLLFGILRVVGKS